MQDSEKTVLVVIIPLQVIENIASVVIGVGAVLKDWQTDGKAARNVQKLQLFKQFLRRDGRVSLFHQNYQVDGERELGLLCLCLLQFSACGEDSISVHW